MNCHRVETILASGVTELTPEVLAHLESCADCARFRGAEEAFQGLLDLAATIQVEPSGWLWQRIDARLDAIQPESRWDEFLRGVRGFLEGPDLRPAWVVLVLALVLSASLTGLRSRSDDGPLLAELQNYELEVPDNPFLPEPGGDSNPFYGGGGQLR